MSDITMPKLSDSMEEGTILSWLKSEGEQIQVGEDLVEIETDKATVTHAAEASGILMILVAEGTSVAVGEIIARVGVAGSVAEAPESPVSAPGAEVASEALMSSSAAELAASFGAPKGNAGINVKATPLARRTATVHSVELAHVAGSGPQGRVTRADVLSKAGIADRPSSVPFASAPAPPAPVPAPAAKPADAKGYATRQELTRLQQVIARRMAEAKATVPHFQVQTEATMDAAVALRAELKALASEGQPVPSFNDIIIKAAAVALREYPLANGSYRDAGFELHERINVGMAVAADGALVVPTVFDADGKSLGSIARETRRLAERVRNGDVSPPELSGGTFTVSNLGMFGMTAITPVVNVPQAAILGVGAMRTVLARIDGEIVDRTLLTLTLSCDHRILYGADASRFLAYIRDLLETPLKLAL